MERIRYDDLNPRQKEVYNFQKLAGVLADYGYNCIKLADDWQGADFLAYHIDHTQTLRVQLKARMTIDKKYVKKDIWIAFPHKSGWFLLPHDELVELIGKNTTYLQTRSWKDEGHYNNANPSEKMRCALKPHRIEGVAQ